jgi:NADPH:quinone reductase-like Zn-dependent oxidoreductase
MRVAAFASLGGPDGVRIRTRDDPEPGAGEAIVDVGACSINHHDLWLLESDGRLDDSELPFVSGLDVAGTVRSVGEGVTSVSAGDRVVLCPNETCGACRYCREGPENLCSEYGLYHGGLAERARVEADRLIELPEALSIRAAAAIPTAYMTAWRMLKLADVEPTDLVFVPGGTGGVGVAAIQLANVLCAETIGTTRSEGKLDRLASIGTDHGIAADAPDALVDEIEAIGRPDAVINHLGGAFTTVGIDVMARGGRMAVCGRTAGRVSEVSVTELFRNHKRIVGNTMGTQGDLHQLIELAAEGAFEPAVGDTYDLDATAAAFADMQRGDLFGKLLVEP